MDQSKKPWESKTIVLNGIFGLIAFIAIVFPQASVAGDFLKGHGDQIAMVWSLLNVVLRAVTKDKISLVD